MSLMNKRDVGLPGAQFFKAVVNTQQASLLHLAAQESVGFAQSNIAKVVKAYSDRNTCDIESWSGQTIYNVPVMCQGGLINEEVYGELDVPNVGSWVVIDFIGDNESQPYICGTIIPFMYDKYQSAQTPVNSMNKQFTLKLLEAGKEKFYRKIFQSGTTIEVKDDGSTIIELPSGTYINADEGGGTVHIEQPQSGKPANIFEMGASGIKWDDCNGNKIEPTSTSLILNGNLEVKQ